MIETVGLVGVGTMGEPMGESLLRAGNLVASTRRPEPQEDTETDAMAEHA